MLIGSAMCLSRPTVTSVAELNDENAWAATRSAGTPPWPSRSSPRRTDSVCTPGWSLTVILALPVATAEPSCRPRRRLSGVNRHSSSRPCGTSNASTSKDENNSPLFNAAVTCAAPPRRGGRCVSYRRRRGSSDRALHLQLAQPVELQRVLHRQFLGDRLDEAAHHHRP